MSELSNFNKRKSNGAKMPSDPFVKVPLHVLGHIICAVSQNCAVKLKLRSVNKQWEMAARSVYAFPGPSILRLSTNFRRKDRALCTRVMDDQNQTLFKVLIRNLPRFLGVALPHAKGQLLRLYIDSRAPLGGSPKAHDEMLFYLSGTSIQVQGVHIEALGNSYRVSRVLRSFLLQYKHTLRSVSGAALAQHIMHSGLLHCLHECPLLHTMHIDCAHHICNATQKQVLPLLLLLIQNQKTEWSELSLALPDMRANRGLFERVLDVLAEKMSTKCCLKLKLATRHLDVLTQTDGSLRDKFYAILDRTDHLETEFLTNMHEFHGFDCVEDDALLELTDKHTGLDVSFELDQSGLSAAMCRKTDLSQILVMCQKTSLPSLTLCLEAHRLHEYYSNLFVFLGRVLLFAQSTNQCLRILIELELMPDLKRWKRALRKLRDRFKLKIEWNEMLRTVLGVTWQFVTDQGDSKMRNVQIQFRDEQHSDKCKLPYEMNDDLIAERLKTIKWMKMSD